jgi:ATP sulfurylase
MIVRKNYGCTHFIAGRDMAGSKSSLTGQDFYGMYDAQEAATAAAAELGMKTVTSQDVFYTDEKGYVEAPVAKQERPARALAFGDHVPADAAKRRGDSGMVCFQERRGRITST